MGVDAVQGAPGLFPPVPYGDWKETKATLHRFAQVVGKLRLASTIRRNHWWNIPFHLTGRGITTRPMGLDPVFCIDFDFVAHRLVVLSATGQTISFPLAGQSVASFYARTMDALSSLGIDAAVERPEPFDLGDHIPFAEDTVHAAYDPAAVNRYWRVLGQVAQILEEFSAGYSGKTSPVHHFWHTFDIAVTRFSDRRVHHGPDVDAVTREAYSREVVSFGFWFGDETFPEPAFYSYTAPEPRSLADQPLEPATAIWVARGSGHLAVLRYDDARAGLRPKQAVLD
ncbi:MAG: DUF5996 family protein, partial [Actinomycetota bacterium]